MTTSIASCIRAATGSWTCLPNLTPSRSNVLQKFALKYPKNRVNLWGSFRGVASVRCLQQFSPTIVHELFIDAVASEFQKEYGISVPVRVCFVLVHAQCLNV